MNETPGHSEVIGDDLLYAETALASCGLVANEAFNRECWPLLKIICRKYKMQSAFIVDRNANRIIFQDNRGPGTPSFKICGDLLADKTVNADIADRLRHGVRAYIGVNMVIESKCTTLISTSMEPRTFTPDTIQTICEISSLVEDKFKSRRETIIANTVANLSISSVLLTSIKAYLQATTTCMEMMDKTYMDITCPSSSSSVAVAVTATASVVGPSRSRTSSGVSDAAPSSSHTTAPTSTPTSSRKQSFLRFFVPEPRRAGDEATLATVIDTVAMGPDPTAASASATATATTRLVQGSPTRSAPDTSFAAAAAAAAAVGATSGSAGRRDHEVALWREMGQLSARFEVLQGHVQDAIERSLMVAQHYTTKDKNKYYVSCFHTETAGFVEGMNNVLQGLAKLIPDHSLMWAYNVNAALAHCVHRTFYSHLLFFLETLVFHWTDYCSSAQINIAFEPQGLIDYYSPKNHTHLRAGHFPGAGGGTGTRGGRGAEHSSDEDSSLGQAAHVAMNNAMLNNTLSAYNNYLQNVTADEHTHVYDPNAFLATPITMNRAGMHTHRHEPAAPPTNHMINAANVDEYEFNYDTIGSGAAEAAGTGGQAQAQGQEEGQGDDVAMAVSDSALESMNLNIDIGAIIARASMDQTNEDEGGHDWPAGAPGRSASEDDDYEDDEPSPPEPDGIYGKKRMALNLFIDTTVQPVTANKGFIQHGYLRILFQPLDLVMDADGSPSARHDISKKLSESMKATGAGVCSVSPLLNTAELMRVLGDFLFEIDTKAIVSLAPKGFMRVLPEPSSIAFMIVLPCFFKLSNDDVLSMQGERGTTFNMKALAPAAPPIGSDASRHTARKVNRAKRIKRNSSAKKGHMTPVKEGDELQCMSSGGSVSSFASARRGSGAVRAAGGVSSSKGTSSKSLLGRMPSLGMLSPVRGDKVQLSAPNGHNDHNGHNDSKPTSLLQNVVDAIAGRSSGGQRPLAAIRNPPLRGESSDLLNVMASVDNKTHPGAMVPRNGHVHAHGSSRAVPPTGSNWVASVYQSLFRHNSVQPS